MVDSAKLEEGGDISFCAIFSKNSDNMHIVKRFPKVYAKSESNSFGHIGHL